MIDADLYREWAEVERLHKEKIKLAKKRSIFLKLYKYFRFIVKESRIFWHDPWKF